MVRRTRNANHNHHHHNHHFRPHAYEAVGLVLLTVLVTQWHAPVVAGAEAAAGAGAGAGAGGRVLCPDGASHHTLVATANVTGHWAATLQLEKNSRLFRRAEAVRLDVRPAAYACGDVRTVAMMVQLTGPPTSASVTTTAATIAEEKVRIPPSNLGYTRAPTYPKFYKVYNKKLNWNDAKAACEEDGAHLVVINSPEEASALAYLIHPLAKSLTRTLHAGFFAAGTDYYTISGEALDDSHYKNWAPGEPKQVDICGAIDHTGSLNDAYCSHNVKRNFVCEYGDPPPARRGARHSGQPPVPTPATNAGNASPEGYTRLPGAGLFKVHLENATWAEANAACQREGGQLAVMESEAEAAALRKHLYDLNAAQPLPQELHVGIFSNSAFVTLFGEDLADAGYESWADGEPNNNPCVVTLLSLSMASVGCALKTAFICEQMIT